MMIGDLIRHAWESIPGLKTARRSDQGILSLTYIFGYWNMQNKSNLSISWVQVNCEP